MSSSSTPSREAEIAGEFDRRLPPAEMEFVGTGEVGRGQPIDILAALRQGIEDGLLEPRPGVMLCDELFGLHASAPVSALQRSVSRLASAEAVAGIILYFVGKRPRLQSAGKFIGSRRPATSISLEIGGTIENLPTRVHREPLRIRCSRFRRNNPMNARHADLKTNARLAPGGRTMISSAPSPSRSPKITSHLAREARHEGIR